VETPSIIGQILFGIFGAFQFWDSKQASKILLLPSGRSTVSSLNPSPSRLHANPRVAVSQEGASRAYQLKDTSLSLFLQSLLKKGILQKRKPTPGASEIQTMLNQTLYTCLPLCFKNPTVYIE
jgi:hypothetical protein